LNWLNLLWRIDKTNQKGGASTQMNGLLTLSAIIDRLLGFVARIAAWAGFLLACLIVYDVITRYFGVPKPFGLNSTKIQEFEYWLHTFLFSLLIGYAYTRQAHVRIDLIRDGLPIKAKYVLEILGCLLLLIPFTMMAIYYSFNYVQASYGEGEVSKSVIGLSHIWILKAALPVLFILLLLAGISQLIKSIAGLRGYLPVEKIAETLGGDH